MSGRVAQGEVTGWRGRPTVLVAVAVAAAMALVASACSGGSHQATPPTGAGGTAGTTTTTAPPSPVQITPANGATGADPSAGISVNTTQGTLTSVTVHTAGDAVSGSLTSGTAWRSAGNLDVSQTYSVTATASLPSGGTLTNTSTFHTLTPSRTFQTQIFEGADKTYGVGMPIILYFDQTITNKAAVEKLLQVSTSKPVVGAWYWDDNCNLAVTCAYFRPRDYWPSNTAVHFSGRLDGVEGASGVYGTHNLSQTFVIGASLVAVGNTATHRTQIYQNGKLLYNWPISSGKPGDDTPNGSYLTIEKGNPVQMTGPGYSISVPWSVRFTFSGDYYHDAYWSVGQQGFENVSHGCVNLSPADAEIYYNMAIPGDPITIVGSPSGGKWDNGWTEWFLSWTQLVQGSALHEAVKTGPSGSTFVSPSSLAASSATAPILTSPANNSAAA